MEGQAVAGTCDAFKELPLEAATLARAPEAALRALSLAMVLLAVALVWLRLA